MKFFEGEIKLGKLEDSKYFIYRIFYPTYISCKRILLNIKALLDKKFANLGDKIILSLALNFKLHYTIKVWRLLSVEADQMVQRVQ